MLHEQTLFNTIDLVDIAIERIKNFEPKDGYYVAFSGGKDSIVVLDLVQKAGVKYDAHFNLTSVDPPELIRFIMKNYRYVERHRPARTMWQLIVDHKMPPTRLVRYCCRELKEGGGRGRLVVTGVRWEESSKRRQRKMVESCTHSKNTRYLHPIIDWSDGDVWEYIHSNGLPYPVLYDVGFKRIGCIGCPMSTHRQAEFGRWPNYEQKYRNAFAAAIKAIRDTRGEDYTGQNTKWETGDDMFDWWMEEKTKKDKAQYVLFE